MVRVAHIHMSGCTGCLISLTDTYEKLLDILGSIDLVYSLTLMDEKTEINETDEKILIERKIPDNIDIALVEGAVCLDDEHSIKDILETRKKAKIVVALGACAATGGVLRYSRGGQMSKPAHASYVAVGDVIKVDLAIPGCPPSPETIVKVIILAINGDTKYLQPFAEFAQNSTEACGCDLITNVVNKSLCMGCGSCASACPTRAIEMVEGRPNILNEVCIKCGACSFQCPRIRIPEQVKEIEQ
ncbi:coenzyme F420 hydrogenase subunit gamma [Methanothermococcus okinawensis]|uniref:Coenzyme F420 hydrogenase subunit gamma n=1 Tax=Methanothermococcus okinawensis (strain DSM 14208 / JCM 11175 / IH1) TaxID=647113 RepID=F8ANB2_METOI|nr:coenzyme F420 hydrogenase subunit gamma [Methanothermococcus okinawensis]AEH06171.1 coenzyme F420 hydrogenase, subunit gamma [Methanothermococcus okinawensis IH1]